MADWHSQVKGTGNQITLTSQGVLFYDSVAVELI